MPTRQSIRTARLLWQTGGLSSLGHRTALWWRGRRTGAAARLTPPRHLARALAIETFEDEKVERVRVAADEVTVYSAVFGDYDQLQAVPPCHGSVRFVCFTDDASLAAPGWELRTVARPLPCPVRSARWFKIRRPFADAATCKYSIWLDGNLQLQVSPRWLIQQLEQACGGEGSGRDTQRPWQLATFAHPERKCLYDELRWVSYLGLDSPDVLRSQERRYRRRAWAPKSGLAETSLLVRRHSPATERFEAYWWDELERGSRRDQLSFPIAAEASGLPIHYLRGGRELSPLVAYHPHLRRDPPDRLSAGRKVAA